MKIKKSNLKFILLLLMVQSVVGVQAQMRVGGNVVPNQNAVLDLNVNDTEIGVRGLLLPRVALVSTTSPLPLTEHVAGMQVFNTATSNDVTPGVYYNDGTRWVRFRDDGTCPEPTMGVQRHSIVMLDKEVSTESTIFRGTTDPVSPNLIVVNIKPVYTFSSEEIPFGLFEIESRARADDNGSIDWVIHITSMNFDPDMILTLESVIITYFCYDQTAGSSPSPAPPSGGGGILASSNPVPGEPEVVGSTINYTILVGR